MAPKMRVAANGNALNMRIQRYDWTVCDTVIVVVAIGSDKPKRMEIGRLISKAAIKGSFPILQEW